MVAAVAPFALERGLVAPKSSSLGKAKVRIHSDINYRAMPKVVVTLHDM
jgi:2-methylaconitate cis-trans-isomerase PrpF